MCCISCDHCAAHATAALASVTVSVAMENTPLARQLASTVMIDEMYKMLIDGDVKSIRMWLDAGVDADIAHDAKGWTPLFIVCFTDRLALVRLLLDRGANTDKASIDGATPLLITCQEGHAAVARLLLGAGADIDKAANDGCTPLSVACQKGHEKVARLLLDKGANKEKATIDGATPLHVACQEGHTKVVQLLLARGADIERAANNGATPLFIARQMFHIEVVELLLKHGAEVKATGVTRCAWIAAASYLGSLLWEWVFGAALLSATQIIPFALIVYVLSTFYKYGRETGQRLINADIKGVLGLWKGKSASAKREADRQEEEDVRSRGEEALEEEMRELEEREKERRRERQATCRVCTVRGTLGTIVKLCGKCRRVAYCSAKCQNADWPKHKKECNKQRGGARLNPLSSLSPRRTGRPAAYASDEVD